MIAQARQTPVNVILQGNYPREAVIKNKKFYIGLLIGAVFLYFTLRQIDLASSWQYIKEASIPLALAAVAVYSFAFLVRAIRWKYLLEPVIAATPLRLYFFLLLGFFMNNTLPFRLGELIRANITGQKLGASRSSVLATIVLERLFDGLSYVILFFVTIVFLPFPAWAKRSMTAGALVFACAMLALFFLARNRQKAVRVFSLIPFPSRFKLRLSSIFENFIGGLTVFSRGTTLLKILVLSLAVWTIEGSVFLVLSRAFHIDLNLFQCLLTMIIIGMGAILPTAPGYVGTVEFLGTTALMFIGVDKNLAFGYIITLHVLQLITVAFWGIIGLVKEKITFAELIRIENKN